jgi:L-iditol 2-dehydrogenase|tara:strand:- start:2101 stop:3144 length:1044 start_codon:yes stop_codon:yes gene_type:complete
LTNRFIKNKSIYLTGINKFKIEESKKRISKKDLLIKVEACGICSSDLKFIYTGSRIKKYPVVLGHEIAGTIGKNKYIILGAEAPCLKCPSCKKLKKDTNLCDNPISIGSNFDGGFANYFSINKKVLSKLPHIIYKSKKSLKYGSLAESLACVINGLEITNFKKKQSIAIIGAGYMGLLFVALSKIEKAKNISVIDFDKSRLKIAKKLGANNLFEIKKNDKNIINKILQPTKDTGYDVVISANASLNAHELACKLVGKRGTINLFGGIPKNINKKLQIDANFIHYKQATITGSFSSNQKHLDKAFKIIKNKSIDFSKLVTSYANYNNFKNKIKLLKNKKEIKSIFRPN